MTKPDENYQRRRADQARNSTPLQREQAYGDALRPHVPTDEEARKVVFDATNAWPYERSTDAPPFMGDPPDADHIAREVQTYVEDETRPTLGKFEFAVIVAFVVLVILGVAYLFGGRT